MATILTFLVLFFKIFISAFPFCFYFISYLYFIKIFISANNYNHEHLIFKYEINEASGYPCSIKYSGKDIMCNSDADLTGSLEKMVKYQGLMIREKVREIESFFSKQDTE